MSSTASLIGIHVSNANDPIVMTSLIPTIIHISLFIFVLRFSFCFLFFHWPFVVVVVFLQVFLSFIFTGLLLFCCCCCCFYKNPAAGLSMLWQSPILDRKKKKKDPGRLVTKGGLNPPLVVCVLHHHVLKCVFLSQAKRHAGVDELSQNSGDFGQQGWGHTHHSQGQGLWCRSLSGASTVQVWSHQVFS